VRSEVYYTVNGLDQFPAQHAEWLVVMGCADNEHLWTAMFYESGGLAFWFCSRCGEVDRDTGSLTDRLEGHFPSVDSDPEVSYCAVAPPMCVRKWKLADGSILAELAPCSVSYRGINIPGLTAAHQYEILDAEGSVIRSYRASRERTSSTQEKFILTRFQVENNQLVKYRVSCNGEVPCVSEASGIAILTGLIAIPSQ
jgi:hypothetical protein